MRAPRCFVAAIKLLVLASACLVLVLAHPPRVPARASRLEFWRAINQVRFGWTKAQVRSLLGDPDDVRHMIDSEGYGSPGREIWAYGAVGHHAFPSLGRVFFEAGRVEEIVGDRGTPPPPTVIGEAELVEHMRRMHRPPSYWNAPEEGDSLWLIQVTNDLIPLGKEKALAVIGEYDRVAGNPNHLLFWLVRVLFVPARPGGTFPVPGIGEIWPPPPRDLSRWPTYPVVIVDDVPISLFRTLSILGSPEKFSDYLRDHHEEWRIRPGILTPPDDPFPVYKKIIASPEWPFPKADPNRSRFGVPYLEDEGHALQEVLRLVRTAYRPEGVEEEIPSSINGLNYEKYRQGFLKVGGRWDRARQMYVRRDGSYIPDPSHESP